MINGMQLLVNLPLFDVHFPSLSKTMVDNLISIATFDVLPTDDIFDATLAAPSSEEQDE